jgi:hypothetical protein
VTIRKELNMRCGLGEITPSYILHTRAFGTYLLGGGGYLPCKKIIRWWYFTCKKLENIICDGILHVNMFHYFKIPYFTCNYFTKFTYNEYIGPYFFIARCSMIFAQWSFRGCGGITLFRCYQSFHSNNINTLFHLSFSAWICQCNALCLWKVNRV